MTRQLEFPPAPENNDYIPDSTPDQGYSTPLVTPDSQTEQITFPHADEEQGQVVEPGTSTVNNVVDTKQRLAAVRNFITSQGATSVEPRRQTATNYADHGGPQVEAIVRKGKTYYTIPADANVGTVLDYNTLRKISPKRPTIDIRISQAEQILPITKEVDANEADKIFEERQVRLDAIHETNNGVKKKARPERQANGKVLLETGVTSALKQFGREVDIYVDRKSTPQQAITDIADQVGTPEKLEEVIVALREGRYADEARVAAPYVAAVVTANRLAKETKTLIEHAAPIKASDLIGSIEEQVDNIEVEVKINNKPYQTIQNAPIHPTAIIPVIPDALARMNRDAIFTETQQTIRDFTNRSDTQNIDSSVIPANTILHGLAQMPILYKNGIARLNPGSMDYQDQLAEFSRQHAMRSYVLQNMMRQIGQSVPLNDTIGLSLALSNHLTGDVPNLYPPKNKLFSRKHSNRGDVTGAALPEVMTDTQWQNAGIYLATMGNVFAGDVHTGNKNGAPPSNANQIVRDYNILLPGNLDTLNKTTKAVNLHAVPVEFMKWGRKNLNTPEAAAAYLTPFAAVAQQTLHNAESDDRIGAISHSLNKTLAVTELNKIGIQLEHTATNLGTQLMQSTDSVTATLNTAQQHVLASSGSPAIAAAALEPIFTTMAQKNAQKPIIMNDPVTYDTLISGLAAVKGGNTETQERVWEQSTHALSRLQTQVNESLSLIPTGNDAHLHDKVTALTTLISAIPPSKEPPVTIRYQISNDDTSGITFEPIPDDVTKAFTILGEGKPDVRRAASFDARAAALTIAMNLIDTALETGPVAINAAIAAKITQEFSQNNAANKTPLHKLQQGAASATAQSGRAAFEDLQYQASRIDTLAIQLAKQVIESTGGSTQNLAAVLASAYKTDSKSGIVTITI